MGDRRPGPDAGPVIRTLSRMHCDTGAMLSQRLSLGDSALMSCFAQLFETWDGSGLPNGIAGEAIRPEVQAASLASDLEVWSRVYGLPKALSMLESAAGARHDPALVAITLRRATKWLQHVTQDTVWHHALSIAQLPEKDGLNLDETARLLGDYADLKLPDLQRPGRRAADLLSRAGADPATIRAGQMHSLGWASAPNRLAVKFYPLAASVSEACRLVPHWSTRALSRASVFKVEARRLGKAYEHADGCGFPAGLLRAEVSAEDALLQTAVLIARSGKEAAKRASENGQLCRDAAHRIFQGFEQPIPARPWETPLSGRERDVLSHLAQGLSNKEIARRLEIAPSTVGTHVENIYRKLNVCNRATATLRALEIGLLA